MRARSASAERTHAFWHAEAKTAIRALDHDKPRSCADRRLGAESPDRNVDRYTGTTENMANLCSLAPRSGRLRFWGRLATTSVADIVDVYLLGGQSNMQGVGLLEDVQIAHPLPT